MTQRSLKTVLSFGVIAALAIAGQTLVSAQQSPAAGTPPHVVLSSQQDRQRMMDQLKITLFPSGPGAYLASTYDESAANPYPNLTRSADIQRRHQSDWRSDREHCGDQ